MQSAARAAKESLSLIEPVMRRVGVTLAPEEFHDRVNIIFHRYESRSYDQIHQNMWKSLPQQFDLLVADFWATRPQMDRPLAALDIGCGTGLATELMLRTPLGSRIATIDMVDTSAEMIEKAERRMSKSGKRVSFFNGTVQQLQARRKYDVIYTCSVLHHIPDLESFVGTVSALQAPGGIFLHIQDPNGEAMNDPELQRRMASVPKERRRWKKRLKLHRIVAAIRRRLLGEEKSYIQAINDELLAEGVIRKPMEPDEIWNIVDLRVHDGKGIVVGEMRQLLRLHRLISARSYSFFGEFWSDLPPELQREEEKLIEQRAMNGSHIGAIWQRRVEV